MKQAQSTKEVIDRLNGLHAGDKEAAHTEADSLLLDALVECRQFEVVDAYIAARKRVGFWYA